MVCSKSDQRQPEERVDLDWFTAQVAAVRSGIYTGDSMVTLDFERVFPRAARPGPGHPLHLKLLGFEANNMVICDFPEWLWNDERRAYCAFVTVSAVIATAKPGAEIALWYPAVDFSPTVTCIEHGVTRTYRRGLRELPPGNVMIKVGHNKNGGHIQTIAPPEGSDLRAGWDKLKEHEIDRLRRYHQTLSMPGFDPPEDAAFFPIPLPDCMQEALRHPATGSSESEADVPVDFIKRDSGIWLQVAFPLTTVVSQLVDAFCALHLGQLLVETFPGLEIAVHNRDRTHTWVVPAGGTKA